MQASRVGDRAASRADGLQRLLRPSVQSTLDINEARFSKDGTVLEEQRLMCLVGPSREATAGGNLPCVGRHAGMNPRRDDVTMRMRSSDTEEDLTLYHAWTTGGGGWEHEETQSEVQSHKMTAAHAVMQFNFRLLP